MKVLIAGRERPLGPIVSAAGSMIGIVAVFLPWIDLPGLQITGWDATYHGEAFEYAIGRCVLFVLLLVLGLSVGSALGHDMRPFKRLPAEAAIALFGIIVLAAVLTYCAPWESWAGIGLRLEVAAVILAVAGGCLGLVSQVLTFRSRPEDPPAAGGITPL